MRTERSVRGDQSGFTLVEVLVAMVILAIGLLGLEALGIGAARSVALANRQSEYATRAQAAAEEALQALRVHAADATAPMPQSFCRELDPDRPDSDRISRLVDTSDPNRPVVLVRVIPNSSSFGAPHVPFEIRSSIYSPDAINTPADGAPCS